MASIRNKFANKIYRYIYIHSGETILVKDIIEFTGISKATVHKYLKWLIRRNLIKRNGKKMEVVPD